MWNTSIHKTRQSAAPRNMADTAAKREADSLENEDLLLKAKRAKGDDKDGQDRGEGESKCDNILSGFVTSQILNDSAREKSIFIHGKVSVFCS